MAGASKPVSARIKCEGPDFVDEHGRVRFLRGVNFSGDSKMPMRPNGNSHLPGSMPLDHEGTRDLSFVGRPVPLEEADEHLSRLHSWGFSCLRFMVTWEAIEHAGPGIYDEEYLDYIREVVIIAQRYGFAVYIDPHQDAWSRFTGGSGAPGWTLECVGFDLTAMTETGCALTHQSWQGSKTGYPKMIWPTNYTKLCCCSMFTLFFGGNRYAPGFLVDGVPVQNNLQDHYIGAVCALAARLADLHCVVGFGTMNEPNPGYIGVKDLDQLYSNLKRGYSPTPVQSFALGAGFAVKVPHLNKVGLPNGSKVLNPGQRSVWREGYSCIWEQQGIWEPKPEFRSSGSGCCGSKNDKVPYKLLKPKYFENTAFGREHYLPFAQKFAARVRAASGRPNIQDIVPAVFLELPPHQLGVCTIPEIKPTEVPGAVSAPHWYDNITLYLGQFHDWFSIDIDTKRPKIGSKAVRKMFVQQLKDLKDEAEEKFGGVPTLIGEVGIPFNMGGGASYNHGKWEKQVEAMDASMVALEANLLNYTLWNYTATHTPQYGDGWNMEDLSIFSPSKRTDPSDINSGGRALEAVVRPFAHAVAGIPLLMSFRRSHGYFRLEFETDSKADGPAGVTEIFVPLMQYPDGFFVDVSDGTWEARAHDKHLKSKLICYRHSTAGVHIVEIFDPAKITKAKGGQKYRSQLEARKSHSESGVNAARSQNTDTASFVDPKVPVQASSDRVTAIPENGIVAQSL